MSQSAKPASSVDLASLVESQSLPGEPEIRSVDDTLHVSYSHADLVIKLKKRPSQPLWDTKWEVSVREPTPGLGTWWGAWSQSFAANRADIGNLLAGEITETACRIRNMLDDHSSIIPVPDL